jgi:hypothetical protein
MDRPPRIVACEVKNMTTEATVARLMALADEWVVAAIHKACSIATATYSDADPDAKKAALEAALREALDLGAPVAWWRWSDVDRSDADVQIGRERPTEQLMRSNGQEWKPLYAPKAKP